MRESPSPAPYTRRPRDGETLRLRSDGRIVAEGDVVWLPPFEAGTVIALGLNYADHAKELALKHKKSRWYFSKARAHCSGIGV